MLSWKNWPIVSLILSISYPSPPDYLVSHRRIWNINNILRYFCIYHSSLAGTVSPVLSTLHTNSSCKLFGTEKKRINIASRATENTDHLLPPNKVHELSQSQEQRWYFCVTVLVPCFQLRDFSVNVLILQLFFSIKNLSVQCCISSFSSWVLHFTPQLGGSGWPCSSCGFSSLSVAFHGHSNPQTSAASCSSTLKMRTCCSHSPQSALSGCSRHWTLSGKTVGIMFQCYNPDMWG